MKNQAWIILVLLGLACGVKEDPPKAPLDREKFQQVLTESLLIEARTKEDLQVDKRSDDRVAGTYAEMFKKQGVSEADFKATYDAYLARPEELKSVYQDVLNELQQRADSTGQ